MKVFIVLLMASSMASAFDRYYDSPPNYAYGYDVNLEFGNNFGQSERRDGDSTYGSYHVQLPDGRLQTVDYHVSDDLSGYIVDVSYEGTPVYDYNTKAPSYVVAEQVVHPTIAHGFSHGVANPGGAHHVHHSAILV